MYLQENTELCVLHALSPVHAGAGAATGAVDLPIQRERHSGWPHIQASGVKGAFRGHCESAWMLRDLAIDKLVTSEKRDRALELGKRIFGKSDSGDSQAGAIAFSDAKLLAFPVRSNLAPFVWVVCPALLRRLARDLALAGRDAGGVTGITVDADHYALVRGDLTGDLILEDVCLRPQQIDCGPVQSLFEELAPAVERLVVVPDGQFSFLVETATEVQAQIAIDAATGTTVNGSLRYQELLPAETVLYTVVFFGAERVEEENALVLETLKTAVKEAASEYIQMGGDLTLGRGIFRMAWIKGGAA